MDSNKKTAIIVGILFIIATGATSIGVVILTPIIDGPEYLNNVSANEIQVLTGVLFQLINCAAVVAIPFMLFPVLKKHNEALALGYLGSRIIESVICIISNISLLSLLTLCKEYIKAGAQGVSFFQPSITLSLAVNHWTDLLGILIVFSFSALILNYVLYRSKLVPRFISAWGFIGAVLLISKGLLDMFNE